MIALWDHSARMQGDHAALEVVNIILRAAAYTQAVRECPLLQTQSMDPRGCDESHGLHVESCSSWFDSD